MIITGLIRRLLLVAIDAIWQLSLGCLLMRTIASFLIKYRFPVPIDFKSCREEIAGALQEFCNSWCKREHVESNALNSWKLNIFKIINGRISFYCNNLDLLPPKPKFTFRHLKKGIQEFHKLHKRPYKSRFIANSSACTTTELFILLTSCFTSIKTMLLNIAQ